MIDAADRRRRVDEAGRAESRFVDGGVAARAEQTAEFEVIERFTRQCMMVFIEWIHVG